MKAKKTTRVIPGSFVLVLLVLIVSSAAMASSKEKVIYNFTNGADGGFPMSGLIADSSGNLYGLTSSGGAYGWGTVFELTPNQKGGWNYNVIYSFTGGRDGGTPAESAGLTFDSDGNLYGTTLSGSADISPFGTVFRLRNTNGSWTFSHSWLFSSMDDGAFPIGGVILDSKNNVYGTTAAGDISGSAPYGTVFKLVTTGKYWSMHVLHSFSGGLDGAGSAASLVMDAEGNLYGTAAYGGAYGQGVAFKLAKKGWKETVLHAFTGDESDGSGPSGNLVFDTAGNLYGIVTNTTNQFDQGGGAFKLSPRAKGEWDIAWLYHFTGGTDGGNPSGGMIFDSAGNLYGTTSVGGLEGCGNGFGCGVVYKIIHHGQGKSETWKEKVLYTFTFGNDGGEPVGNLFLDKTGTLFGTVPYAGASFSGLVFQMKP
jgi:uncharacterized repeat protein (TIGR03803 family)